jgi:UDP-glucuronate 4-epimerase
MDPLHMSPSELELGIMTKDLNLDGNMNTARLKVLLTGGAGFIGSHLAEALLHRPVELCVVDNLDDFYSPAQKSQNLAEMRQVGDFEFLQADICDYSSLREIFARTRPDLVIHLAARAGVRPSIDQPILYEKVNVSGTMHLLDLSREFRVQRFIFGSSSSVYGLSSKAPFSEDLVEFRPISPYAATKLAGEMLCFTYSHLFGMPVICLRFFTVYGPRQRPDLAIHKFTALLEAGEPTPVFGDGSTGRDYTNVADIVRGILAACDLSFHFNGQVPFEVFNLGNSHPVKLTELLETLERVTGRTAKREYKPMQPGDVFLTWADISKAKRLLGYSPLIPFEEGLRQFVDWYRSNRLRVAASSGSK